MTTMVSRSFYWRNGYALSCMTHRFKMSGRSEDRPWEKSARLIWKPWTKLQTTVLYCIRGSDLCTAIVKLYHMYYLYHLVPSFSSYLCAAYLDYSAALTQILRAFAAPTQFVAATTSWRWPPLPVARRTSRDNGGSPLAPANFSPYIPTLSESRPIRSVCPIQTVASQFLPLYHPSHKIQFIRVKRIKLIWSSVFSEGNPPTSLL